MDLDLLGAQSAAMAASGESCRRRGHAVVSLTDPGCVKTRRGIATPGILSPVVTRRAEKSKNSSSARHYDQIRFRFRTAWTQSRHRLCAAAFETMLIGRAAEHSLFLPGQLFDHLVGEQLDRSLEGEAANGHVAALANPAMKWRPPA
jgi:hypothetical protein